MYKICMHVRVHIHSKCSFRNSADVYSFLLLYKNILEYAACLHTGMCCLKIYYFWFSTVCACLWGWVCRRIVEDRLLSLVESLCCRGQDLAKSKRLEATLRTCSDSDLSLFVKNYNVMLWPSIDGLVVQCCVRRRCLAPCKISWNSVGFVFSVKRCIFTIG